MDAKKSDSLADMLEPSDELSDSLSQLVPEKDLPMAKKEFQKRFKHMNFSKVDENQLSEWLETLPIAHV